MTDVAKVKTMLVKQRIKVKSLREKAEELSHTMDTKFKKSFLNQDQIEVGRLGRDTAIK